MASEPRESAHVVRLDHADGAILFDPERVAQAAPMLLDPASHGARAAASESVGGRGAVWFVEGEFGRAVLRHYRRGGWMARLLGDRYLYTGAERSRGFREFRLLQRLRAEGLRVPRPLLVGLRRSGPWYRADILVERIEGARSLAQRLPGALAESALWRGIGAAVGQLHEAGVWHADLNAHNLLLDPDDHAWVIDFDRCRPRDGEAWKPANLARLQRSLRKLGVDTDGAQFRAAWSAFEDGYRAADDGAPARGTA